MAGVIVFPSIERAKAAGFQPYERYNDQVVKVVGKKAGGCQAFAFAVSPKESHKSDD